ncbi:MAG: CrcB family protein [Oligoflexia bacterium]|nr:CrcB family protein [Oligoflexia bacterium]
MRIGLLIVFGALGVFARFGIDELFLRLDSRFPWSTLWINLLGSLLAGIFYVLGVERGGWAPELRTAVLVGFLGGFTTFSAYTLQSARLFEERYLGEMLVYFCLSPLLGLGACLLGLKLARGMLP